MFKTLGPQLDMDKTERFKSFLEFLKSFRNLRASIKIKSTEFGEFDIHLDGGVSSEPLVPLSPDRAKLPPPPATGGTPGEGGDGQPDMFESFGDLDEKLQEEFEEGEDGGGDRPPV